MSENTFPIMIPLSNRRLFIPWDIIAPFEQRAQKNHGGQTLKILAGRGGLDPMELWAVMHNVSWSEAEKQITHTQALEYAQELSTPTVAVRSISLTAEQRAALSIGDKRLQADEPSELDKALQRIAELEQTLERVRVLMNSALRPMIDDNEGQDD